MNTEKPPIGLTPRWVHNELRAISILSAMQRYIIARTPIPDEWFDELRELYGEG